MLTGGILLGYVTLYVLDAAFGGYDPHYTSDGRNQYASGLLVHDCIMWQPRFGCYYNDYRYDAIGIAFYPLIRLDHNFVHKTHSIAEAEFPKWWESLTDKQIHPNYRSDWRSWKTEKPPK